MTQDQVIELTRALGICELSSKPKQDIHYSLTIHEMQHFAKLVAQHERERIKQANAPEIERINAHIKQLENAVLAEREACALIGNSMDACQDGAIGEAIRARGQA
jgi:hypothetical protein